MDTNFKPDPLPTLKSAKNILLVDWPDQAVPRALISAGFKVFGFSPGGYSLASLIADPPEREKRFPPRNETEQGYLLFEKLENRPEFIDIVNIYRPEAEHGGIIENHVLPLNAEVVWLHPPVISAGTRQICLEKGLKFIEGVDIAEIAAVKSQKPRIKKKKYNMKQKTFFAPELTIDNGVTDVDFYKKAFGAIEIRRFGNDDGSIHVSEMEIDGALFHLHEVTSLYCASPFKLAGTTVTIGLFVDDVDAVIANAVEAGATMISPAQDYFYGYRQGQIVDPHGHRWQIQKRIPTS